MPQTGQPRAIIAPLFDVSVEVPSSVRTPLLRFERLARTIEQFFDPYDTQSFTFQSDWNEIPGASRLQSRAHKAFESLNGLWPDWTVADPTFGVYYPFFARVFEQSGTPCSFELPVWPVSSERLGRYVHRFLSTSTAGIANLELSERGAVQWQCDRSELPILKQTLDLARRSIRGDADLHELRDAFADWNRMGVIRNAYYKPVSVSLQGQEPDGSTLESTLKVGVSRSWASAEFEVRLKPRQEARMFFRPPLRSVYLRSARAEGSERIWQLPIGAGGAATIEALENGVQLFATYREDGFARFSAPPDPSLHRFSFEYQIRDDPVAQLSLLENLTKGFK